MLSQREREGSVFRAGLGLEVRGQWQERLQRPGQCCVCRGWFQEAPGESVPCGGEEWASVVVLTEQSRSCRERWKGVWFATVHHQGLRGHSGGVVFTGTHHTCCPPPPHHWGLGLMFRPEMVT